MAHVVGPEDPSRHIQLAENAAKSSMLPPSTRPLPQQLQTQICCCYQLLRETIQQSLLMLLLLHLTSSQAIS
jgi:hypothetical protein